MPGLFWWLLGGLAVGTGIAVAVSSSSSASEGPAPPEKDFTFQLQIFPHYPPIPPYYAANVRRSKYPICWTFKDGGDWRPGPENGTATDVTGTPYIAFQICASKTGDDYKCADAGFGVPRRTVAALRDETLGQVFNIDTRQWQDVDDTLIGTWQWFQAEWAGDPDFIDRLNSAVKAYIPVVAGIAVSMLATPLAGAITATALEAIIKIADGAPVTDALVESYKDHLQSEVEKTSYYETYKSLRTTYNQTSDNLQAIRQKAIDTYRQASTATGPEAEKQIAAAVDTGIAVARAAILQQAAREAVYTRLPHDMPDGTDYRAWFDLSEAHSVSLSNWTTATFGVEGRQLLQWAYFTAGKALDQGQDPIKAVRPQFDLKKIAPVLGNLFTKGTPESIAPRSFGRSFTRGLAY